MSEEVKPEVVPTDDIKKQVEKEILEKAQKQQDAATQINKILAENDLRLVVEQNIRIIPNQ